MIAWIKKIFSGLSAILVRMVPIFGLVQFVVWVFKDWWASLIGQIISKMDAVLDDVSIAIGWGELEIPWAQINSIIPLTEMISLMITFKAIVIALIVIRWVRIINPFMS